MAADPARPIERNAPEVEAAFEAAPREIITEIIDGVLCQRRLPDPRHSRAAFKLAYALRAFDDEGGGWVLLPRVDVYLGPKPDRLVPELSGWRRERLPELPDEPGVTVAPDWVCEVLSPSTESTVRAGKMRVYCRERVDHVWLIDPQMRRLEVYRHGGAGWSRLETFAGGALVRAEPFDAIEFSLAQLWAW